MSAPIRVIAAFVDAVDYYTTPRAGHPDWGNQILSRSYESLAFFSVLDRIGVVVNLIEVGDIAG